MSYKNCFNIFGIIKKKKHSYSLIALSLSLYIFKNYTLHLESTQIFNQITLINYVTKTPQIFSISLLYYPPLLFFYMSLTTIISFTMVLR